MQECHQRHGCSWRTCHRHSCCSYPCRRSRKPETFFWNRRRGCYFLAEASGLSCLQVWPSLLLPKICYKTYMCAKFVGHGVGPTSSKTPAIPCFLAFKNTISEVLLVKNYHTWKQKWRSKINSQVESDNIWRKKKGVCCDHFLLSTNIRDLISVWEQSSNKCQPCWCHRKLC